MKRKLNNKKISKFLLISGFIVFLIGFAFLVLSILMFNALIKAKNFMKLVEESFNTGGDFILIETANFTSFYLAMFLCLVFGIVFILIGISIIFIGKNFYKK